MPLQFSILMPQMVLLALVLLELVLLALVVQALVLLALVLLPLVLWVGQKIKTFDLGLPIRRVAVAHGQMAIYGIRPYLAIWQ